MSEFSFKLQSIAVAQILNLVGVDRIHHSAHTALVEISQEFLVLMVKKLKDSSNLCGRTGANYLDFGMILDYLDMSADDLIVYLNSLGRAALISKKQEVFKFPRIEPASFPIKCEK
jgi:histone H3/H4